jgi:hypothetical protein
VLRRGSKREPKEYQKTMLRRILVRYWVEGYGESLLQRLEYSLQVDKIKFTKDMETMDIDGHFRGSERSHIRGEKYAKEDGIRKNMSQGELDKEIIELRVQLSHISVGMFYRQRMLVIDGKYNNDDQQRSDNRGGASNSDRWINNSEFLMAVRSQCRQEERADMEDRSRALDPSVRTDHRRIQENLHDL